MHNKQANPLSIVIPTRPRDRDENLFVPGAETVMETHGRKRGFLWTSRDKNTKSFYKGPFFQIKFFRRPKAQSSSSSWKFREFVLVLWEEVQKLMSMWDENDGGWVSRFCSEDPR
jgi:hypothetical protein